MTLSDPTDKENPESKVYFGLLSDAIHTGVKKSLRDDTGNKNVIARRDDEAIPTIVSTETASLPLAVT